MCSLTSTHTLPGALLPCTQFSSKGAALTLSDFLARLADYESHPDGYLAHCPAHDDSDPSLRVTVGKDGDKVLLKCRAGCSTTDVLKALDLSMADLATMTVDDDSRPDETATSTATPAGPGDVARLARDLDQFAGALAHGFGQTSDGVVTPAQREALAALDYARDRFGISHADAERLGLGLRFDREGHARLVVPFRDAEGVPRGYQARAIDPAVELRWSGPRAPEGASWSPLAHLPGGSGWDEVLVTEGPGDGLTACSLGYDVILVAGSGNAAREDVLDAIAASVGHRKVVIAGDGDGGGRRFAAALLAGLRRRDVMACEVIVPDGEDLTSWREQDPSGRTIVRAVLEAKVAPTFDALTRDGRDEQDYPLTDLGNARFVRDFIRQRGEDVRYSPEVGFFLLDTGVWRTDELDAVRASAQETAEWLGAHAARLQEASLPAPTDTEDEAARKKRDFREAQRWTKWARYSQSTQGINAAIREMQALRDVATPFEAFDRRPDLLACLNGVVNLRTGDLLPHDPNYLLTKRIGHNYEPSATAPRWEAFLDEVTPGHVGLSAYLRRLVGYGITGHTDEQCLAILWGGGANGKSVFTDTLAEVFREATVTTPFSTFEQKPSGGIPNDIAALKGARLVMASEGDQGRPMAEAMLKRLTGRDLISARFMRKEFFEFRPTFLLMLASNFKPQFRGQDEGLWRRVKLIPWDRYFAPHERDHHLGAKLLAEAEGILAWAVRGSVEWFANGLRDPQDVKAATAEYRETSNTLDGFLPGAWVFDESAPAVNGSDVYHAYTEWADEEGLDHREVWKRKTLYAALEERGCIKKRVSGGMAFTGIRRATKSDYPETNRAAEPSPAHSSTTNTPTTPGAPSLGDVL